MTFPEKKFNVFVQKCIDIINFKTYDWVDTRISVSDNTAVYKKSNRFLELL